MSNKKAHLFMIHGANCGGWAWNEYKQFFETRGYECTAPDLLYHNVDPSHLPPPQIGNVSLLDYAEDLEKKIRALSVKPIIVGHSMGGLLAQILGQRGLAKGLVLLEPAPPGGSYPMVKAFVHGLFALVKIGDFWHSPIRSTLKESSFAVLHMLSPEKQKEVHDKFVYESGRALAEIGFFVLDKHKSSQVDEKKVACPVLAIAGSQDRLISPKMVRIVAEKYKNHAHYKEFAEHGHWILGEPGWEKVTQYIHEWIEKNIRE